MRGDQLRWPIRAGGYLLLAAVAGLFLAATASAADAPRPAKKDSSKRLQPREVTLETSVTPAVAAPGDTVTYKVKVKLAPHWHIYKAVEEQVPNSPIGTQFDFFDLAGLKPEGGGWEASKDAVKKPEPAFPNLPFLEFYEDEVTWSRQLKVPASATPGAKTLRNQIYFQICDPKQCKPPSRITVPDANVTIKAAARAAATLPATLIAPAIFAASPATPAVAGSVQAKIDQGLGPFLLYAALNGLLALLMPCVWPMLPITVNFFVKQGHANKGKTTGLAITYSLAIVGIFTLIGLFFSIFFGASSTTRLGNNAWLNLLFGLVFVAFGLSLLGLFEIRLPSWLLNASAQAEGRGGLTGVIFMASTLTITSFTCTAPLVGGLLVMASKGQYFYPVLGLLVFSAFLALPFFLLALFPSLMSNMPRSGDWMNSVKVVGGLLEIGAAFKFLNTAEVSFAKGDFTNVWIDAQVLLTVWVVLAFVCGIYLLGLFRSDHDHEAVKVGAPRMLAGSAFLAAALYLAPALFGTPPQSQFYKLITGILPPDAAELDASEKVAALVQSRLASSPALIAQASPGQVAAPAGETGKEVESKSADPKVAVREERKFHGVSWGLSYEDALERARATKRPILIDYTGVNCANCRTMEATIMPRPEVVEELKKFVTVQLYTDFVPIGSIPENAREELAEANQEREQDMIGETTSPKYVVVSPEGRVLATTSFDANPAVFVRFLKEALGKHDTGEKVAGNN